MSGVVSFLTMDLSTHSLSISNIIIDIQSLVKFSKVYGSPYLSSAISSMSFYY